MASPELAEKLRKRLDSTAESEEAAGPHQAPPPAPVIPQKIVENPYVEKADTSIDDLIFKALEKKEENNNNQPLQKTEPLKVETEPVSSAPSIPMHQHQNPIQVDPRSPPPKRSILELLEKERIETELQQQSAPVPKTPVMVISKGAFPRSASPRRQQFVRENEDGNELEKKLAAQRMKKYTEEMEQLVQKPVDVLDEIMKSPPPPQLPTSPPPPTPPARIASVRSDESLEEEDRRRKESEETATFEELEAEIMRISRSPVPPPVFTIPPPPPPSLALPEIPQSIPTQSPPSPRPTSVPPPIPSPGPSEDVNIDELIESFSDSVIINSISPPPPLPPLRESSLEGETADETPEDPSPATMEPLACVVPSQNLAPVAEFEELDLPQERPEAPTPVRDSSLPIESTPAPVPTPQTLEPTEEKERPKAPTPIRDSSLPPPPPPKPETPLAIRRAGPIPTPQLLEMIHQEDCARPLSPTTPSISTSRPQSPAVPKKPSVVSPLGLLCDPHLSHEKPTEAIEQKEMDPVPVPVSPVDETELNDALERRNKILEAVIMFDENFSKFGENVPLKMNKKISLYAEFTEFSRKQIQYFVDTFKKYDEDKDNFIDFNELKRMMEKLGEAQTHIALKELIKKVDEDQDGKISQREFLLIFRLAASGELTCSEVFKTLADSVDVSKEGVLGAANFFQAKIEEQTALSRFEKEMMDEKEEKKRLDEEKRLRREKFLANKSIFH